MGEKAADISAVVRPDDRSVLVAASYLHDIGYAPCLRSTGCHQLDGAAFLRDNEASRLANLVAHHSASRFELELRGWSDALSDFPFEDSPVMDALVFCDLTTGPDGQDMELDERLAEAIERYGQESLVAAALRAAEPDLRLRVRRVETRLKARACAPRPQPR